MDGILIIDKPAGPTSHDVVSEVKKLLGAKKVGHLGTLDPAASGVLPLVINGATKLADKLSGDVKVYEFDLVMGQKTDTDDGEGKIICTAKVPPDALDRLKVIMKNFVGEISQVPPAFSAIKVNGRPLYKSARRGKPIVAGARSVNIYELSILPPLPIPPPRGGRVREGVTTSWHIRMRVRCSRGTYVRALCRDMGDALTCFGHAENIRRIQSGPYKIEDSVELEAYKQLAPAQQLKRIKPLTPLQIIS